MKPLQWTLRAVKRRIAALLVRRHYGVARPAVVQLPGAPSQLHIDPEDPRAYKILVVAPLFGRLPRNRRFWTDACSRLTPALALDVGLNFGECLFSGRYAATTQLHGFEANPRLQPFVVRSRNEHPARSQMLLHFAVVSEQPGPETRFFVDRCWSGGSTAIADSFSMNSDRFVTVHMPTISVDSALAASPATYEGGLVFKIDVEGYEFRVLKGMERTLAAPSWELGLIEYDTALLKQAGESLEQYWTFLSERFEVYAFPRGAKSRGIRVCSQTELAQLFRKAEFHTDLLLVRGEPNKRLDEFVRRWTVGHRPSNTLRRLSQFRTWAGLSLMQSVVRAPLQRIRK